MSLPSSSESFADQSVLRTAADSLDHATAEQSRRLALPWRSLVHRRLENLTHGRLVVRDQVGTKTFGQAEADIAGQLRVRDRRFYRRIAMQGGLGLGESYVHGHWDSPDLTATLRVLAANLDRLRNVESGLPKLFAPVRQFANWLRRNTRAGSRRNISQHYDLSNEFFELMLDPTMTYSSGYFPHPRATLEEASTEKYDRICRQLDLGPSDHVLEIGTGWGGFAVHAAKNYGCRVTTTTISTAQHGYAAKRIESAGLEPLVDLKLVDYRDLQGQFDKLVSIEMIEAVGERFLPTYFAKCSRLLKPCGAMLLQAITIPDCRYDTYRRGVDFIQRHVFPGGFLPSPSAITDCLRTQTDFRLEGMEDFATHYARTLRMWRENLWSRLDAVRELGFDDRFLRLWKYYLAYCEAGFQERQIGVSQWMLTKPAWQRATYSVS